MNYIIWNFQLLEKLHKNNSYNEYHYLSYIKIVWYFTNYSYVHELSVWPHWAWALAIARDVPAPGSSRASTYFGPTNVVCCGRCHCFLYWFTKKKSFFWGARKEIPRNNVLTIRTILGNNRWAPFADCQIISLQWQTTAHVVVPNNTIHQLAWGCNGHYQYSG